MTTLAWRVAWMVSKSAVVEQREDFASHFLADVRVAELRAEDKPVAGDAPYRIDIEPEEGAA